MLTSDKAEAVLQVFCAIQCKWRLWYEPQVSIEKWYLEMLAKNKERRAASNGRDIQPIPGGLSMSLHVSPSSMTGVRDWQLHPHESSVQCGQQHACVLLLQCHYSGGRTPRSWWEVCNHRLVGFVLGTKFSACVTCNCYLLHVYIQDWYLLGGKASHLTFICVYCVLQVNNGQTTLEISDLSCDLFCCSSHFI